MKTARSCGFLIVKGCPIKSFLLMKHPRRWDLPKGHVDPGETDRQCALRELKEETGFPSDAIDIDPVFRFEHLYEVRDKRYGPEPVQKTLIVMLATLTRDMEPVVTEHEGYRWFDWLPPHDIQELTINPVLAAVADHVAATHNQSENG